MNRFYHLAFFALFFPISHASAVEAQVVTLRNVSKLVHEQNPDLRVARLRIQEAEARIGQSGRLSNPEFGSSVQQDRDFRQNMMQLDFSQKFPVTQRLRWEKMLSANAFKAAQIEQLEVERQLLLSAKIALVDILALRQRRDLLKSQMASAQELFTHLETGAARGEFSRIEAAFAKLEATSLSSELRMLDASEASSHGQLKSLLGISAGQPISVAGILPAAEMPVQPTSKNLRPDLQIAALRIEAAEYEIERQKSLRFDDLEASLIASSQRQLDEPNGYGATRFLGLGLRIPLPLWNTNKAAIKAAQLAREREQIEANALERKIGIETQSEKKQMADWAKLVSEFDEILLPLAKQQSEEIHAAYQQSLVELQALFRAREKYHQLTLSRLDAIHEFHLARLQFEAASAKP